MKIRSIAVVCVCTFLLFGCGNKKDDLNRDDHKQETITKKTEWTAKIYHIDDETGNKVAKDVTVTNERDIWKALQEMNLLTEECQLIELKHNDVDKSLQLDIDKNTGDRIRSMGTTGEWEIISCLSQTYLEAYGFESIMIMEEGNVLESGHAVYDYYITLESLEEI